MNARKRDRLLVIKRLYTEKASAEQKEERK